MSSSKIPILLLKTKSVPNDSYEEYFSSPTSPFNPVFVPVLEHKPNIHNLELVKKLLRDGELTRKYGGMIFTSQRAAEGFTQIVQELERGGTVAKGGKEDGEIGYTNGGVGSSMIYPIEHPSSCSPGRHFFRGFSHCFRHINICSTV